VKRAFGCVLALCLASGCGAGGAPPAETPSGAPPPNKSVEDERDQDGAHDDAAEGGEHQFAQPPGSTKQDTQTESLGLDGALALFQKSESELATGIVDCGKACKALGSMERSMDRICELTGPEDPEKRCQSAREKAKAARERVEKHCPDCSSG
jgi:hypothetical protein